jgi:hypothetical protein
MANTTTLEGILAASAGTQAPSTTGYNTWFEPSGVDTSTVKGIAAASDPKQDLKKEPEGKFTPWDPAGAAVSTTPTLAFDTFRNTLAMFFGQEAMSANWVTALYSTVSKFYKTGSSVDESLNLSLQDARNNPELKPFTDRFRGVFALQDRLLKGEAVHVPTIAEYTTMQTAMSDILNRAGLGTMATLDFTSALISKNVSAAEMTDRINNAFLVIDNADPFLKDQFSQYFPMLSRGDLAKGLLLGDQGAIELENKVKGIEVKSAAAQQGLAATDPFGLAKMGVSYDQAKQGYEAIAGGLPTYSKLAGIYGGDQAGAMSTMEAATFGTPGSAEAQRKIRRVAVQEESAFAGGSAVDKASLYTGETAGTL